MDLLNMLLSDWVGRLSLFTILFCVGMLTFIGVWAARHVLKSEESEPSKDPILDEAHLPKL